MTTPAERTAANTEQIAANTDPGNPSTPEASRPPTTTTEQDLRTADSRDQAAKRTAGQRQINLVWEYTQAAIALLVVATTAIAIFVGRIVEDRTGVSLPPEWWTIVGLVIGFYFSRSNHVRIGDERGHRITDEPMDDR